MEITFPGGVAVNADFKGFTVATDQPAANGGENLEPSPFDLFLAFLQEFFFDSRIIESRVLQKIVVILNCCYWRSKFM